MPDRCNHGYHIFRARAGVVKRGALCQCGLAWSPRHITGIVSNWLAMHNAQPVLLGDSA